jgi:hypothetical protein
MRDQVLDRRAVYNGDTGFGPFKGKRSEPGPLPTAHYAHLHSTNLVLDRFNNSVYNAFPARDIFFYRQKSHNFYRKCIDPTWRKFLHRNEITMTVKPDPLLPPAPVLMICFPSPGIFGGPSSEKKSGFG